MSRNEFIQSKSLRQNYRATIIWLLTEVPPKSVGGILATASTMWIPILINAFFNPYGYNRFLAVVSITLGGAAGILSLTGLGRIPREFRMAKTQIGKLSTLLAALPLLIMAALSTLASGIVLVTMLKNF
jgi:hypothetical protein